MPYIKKVVLRGFKSFAKETEIPFDRNMNVFVGPNGAGKTNIVDGLCSVLGRLALKSMRAAKSANLIFAGTKASRAATDASVKLIFDNSDKKFSLPENEITIERTVRSSGQSIYKINNKTKTRQEILELLAQAEIDPYGFNIVLQGEIDNFVKMRPEERRKIIEEIAGISIYETRKEKSLRELEKTEEKLKEVQATLRERTAYLKNLEEERRQALRFKKLEEMVKRCKASIIKRKLREKERELAKINEKKKEKEQEKEKYRKEEQEITKEIDKQEKEIEKINQKIQKSSGIQQEKLNKEISDLRAELSGLNVRKDNAEERISEILSRKEKLEEEIGKKTLEKSKKELQSSLQKSEKLNKQREKLGKEISVFKAEISHLEDIKKQLSRLDICPLCKSKLTEKHVKNVFSDCDEKISSLIKSIKENKQFITKTRSKIGIVQRKIAHLQDNIPKIEILEQNLNETEQLKKELQEIESEIEEKENSLGEREKEIGGIEKKYHDLIEKRTEIENQIRQNNSLLLEKRNKISVAEDKINELKVELARINAEKSNLALDFEPYKSIRIINLPVYALKEKLEKTQQILESIGPVNLRALQVYDKIKEQYDKVAEKLDVLEKEKTEILKIIEEIDRKKKRTFMKTLKAINELFNRNFSQLYVKGQAFLELENKEDPFAGGLDIVIRIAKGKYFDINSLSGGEKTLVALSLIFAIQEYKPYCFYILDEIDATLDKRNSERLAALIKKYMKTGQYIIITHNDAVISESSLLYGVSMQEGISKILSLEV